jgi:hypothetical protein
MAMPKNVLAQQLSLSIYPPLIKATIKPSKSFIVAFTIKNEGDPVFIKPLIKSFSPTGVLGNIHIDNDAHGPIQFSLDNSYISFNKAFFLKTKQSEQLLLRVRVPEGAPYGDYYYSLLAQTEQMPGLIGTHGATSIGAIGSTLLLSVSPTEKTEEKPNIETIEVTPKKSFFFLPNYLYDSSDIIGVKVVARNDGKNRYVVKGRLEVSDGLGKKETHTFVEENILAQSSRLLRASGSAEIDCQKNTLKSLCQNAPFTALLQSFSIGRKKISAIVTYDETGTSSKSIQIVLFPIKLTFAVTILFAFVIILTALFSKKRTLGDTPTDHPSAD